VPSIKANGLDIGYDTVGAGPPIVMLHGATSAGREDFAAQLPLFGQAFLIHLPDARGHGRTRWDAANGFDYRWLVDDLAGFVDALGLRTFHLVGFSMGALTALQFAARHPERVRTLVAVGITTEREPRSSVARRLLDPERILATDPTWAAELSRRHDVGQGPGAWQRLLPAIVAGIAAGAPMGPRELHRIDAPTMIVCGDRDPFVPVDHAWGLSRQIPRARLFVAPDCGHEVTVRRPGLFNEALAGFYRSTEAEARRRAEVHAATYPAPTGMPTADDEIAGALKHPAPAEIPDMEATDAHWLRGAVSDASSNR
jgi:pimeloyl-ACP methyl ester carboxylesterase